MKYLSTACVSTEGREVKIGQYNAEAEELELINHLIKFQGRWPHYKDKALRKLMVRPQA